MADTPWQDDACSLVDAFRAGERSPLEELDATLATISTSKLNNWSHLDPERARQAAADAEDGECDLAVVSSDQSRETWRFRSAGIEGEIRRYVLTARRKSRRRPRSLVEEAV